MNSLHLHTHVHAGFGEDHSYIVLQGYKYDLAISMC